jgi:hypothetical protein
MADKTFGSESPLTTLAQAGAANGDAIQLPRTRVINHGNHRHPVFQPDRTDHR